MIGGNYILGELIGRGGMGVVYEGVQWSLGRRVAIKIPRTELGSDFVHHRFRAEARAGSRLSHENLVGVIDFGEHAGRPFLVMEYVSGVLLGAMITQGAPLELTTITDLTDQILSALEAAHAAGVVHGDVKCDNILVESLGGPRGTKRARLIDFGLACVDGEYSRDPEHTLSGTPEYLAPELIRGEPPSIATDIYGVGVMLYEMLTGTTPFTGGSTKQILARQQHEAPVPPSWRGPREIPRAIEEVVMCALHKRPGSRFADAAACAAALRAAMEELSSPERMLAAGASVFSTWPPTIDCAPGADAAESARVRDLRKLVADAVVHGNAEAIVTAYHELARALIDEHHLAVAAFELEDCVSMLETGWETTSSPLWRVKLTLAALYSGLGEPHDARRSALEAFEHATRACSPSGRERSRTLFARLLRGQQGITERVRASVPSLRSAVSARLL
jgi:tRNA A-37 threonylcarbamoyl transferase component Bud32